MMMWLVGFLLLSALGSGYSTKGLPELSDSRWLTDVTEEVTGHIIFKSDSTCVEWNAEAGCEFLGRFTVIGDTVKLSLSDNWDDRHHTLVLVFDDGKLRGSNSIDGSSHFYYEDECDDRDTPAPHIVFNLPIRFEGLDDLPIWPAGSGVPPVLTYPWSFFVNELDTILVSSMYNDKVATIRNGYVINETQLPEDSFQRRFGHGAKSFFLKETGIRGPIGDSIVQYDRMANEIRAFPANLVGDFVADSTGLWMTSTVVGIHKTRFYAFRYDLSTLIKDSCRLDVNRLPTGRSTTANMISCGNSLYIPTRDTLLEIGPNCATMTKHAFPRLRPWHRMLDARDDRFVAITEYLEVLVHNPLAGKHTTADLKRGLQKVFTGWPGHDYMGGTPYHFDAQLIGDDLLVMGVKQDTTYILSFPIDSL